MPRATDAPVVAEPCCTRSLRLWGQDVSGQSHVASSPAPTVLCLWSPRALRWEDHEEGSA